ncbi:MAG TPA: hypothetical protein PKD54_12515 [Pirellulaceae bacterium]|nr:hypothetical protein [Pirellulaceae bacterium]
MTQTQSPSADPPVELEPAETSSGLREVKSVLATDNLAARGGAWASLFLGVWSLAGAWMTPWSAVNGLLGVCLGGWGLKSARWRIAIGGIVLSLLGVCASLGIVPQLLGL